MRTPTALTVAGSDPSAGAGLQADLKTFAALGVYGCAVVSAITAQNTQGVTAIWPLPLGSVAEQLRCLADDIAIHAMKTGMLHNAAVVAELAQFCQAHRLPLICDPIIVSSSGKPLLDEAGVQLLLSQLLPLTTLLTPNLQEAARLLNQAPASDDAGMIAQAEALLALGPSAVLLTGGHLAGNQASDVLVWRDGQQQSCEILRTARIDTRNTHGTGCTLSAAITASLAKGMTLVDAVYAGKEYVTYALAHADELNIGVGNGPLQHFF